MFTNYIPLRRGLEEHARSGRGFGLTHEEGWAFTIILMRADCETGLWHGSAKALLPYNWNHRQAKKILESLEKKGYIKRFCVPRQRGNYKVAIDKYGVTRGPHRGLIVNAKQSTSPQSMTYECPPGGQLGAPSQEGRIDNYYYRGKHLKITTDQDKKLSGTYPSIDLQKEYAEMDIWLDTQEEESRWKNQYAGARNWCKRTVDRQEKDRDQADVGRGPRTEGKLGKCSACGVEIPAGFLKCLKCMKKKAPVNP